MASGRTTRAIPSRAALVRMLNEAFSGPAWHGPCVLSSLKGVSAKIALWRPGPGRPNVWEQALHCAIGKHLVADRLDPSHRSRFPRPRTSSWWAPSPEIAETDERDAAWQRDLVLLRESHDRLLATLARVPLARLREPHGKSPFLLGEQVAGLAMHDGYHAGQIALVLRLAEGSA